MTKKRNIIAESSNTSTDVVEEPEVLETPRPVSQGVFVEPDSSEEASESEGEGCFASQKLEDIHTVNMPLPPSIVKDIGKSYPFYQNLTYASANMDVQALNLMSHEEKARDKALRSIIGTQRLAQRICEFAFEKATSEDIGLAMQDAITVMRHNEFNLNLLRSSVITRKIAPNTPLVASSEPTVFDSILGPNGFTTYMHRASQTQESFSKLYTIRKRRPFNYGRNHQRTALNQSRVSEPVHQQAPANPPQNAPQQYRSSYRGRGGSPFGKRP